MRWSFGSGVEKVKRLLVEVGETEDHALFSLARASLQGCLRRTLKDCKMKGLLELLELTLGDS